MTAVGVKELKNRLSHYLRLVQAGEQVIVTSNGKPVARMSGPDDREPMSDVDAHVAALVADGIVKMPTKPRKRRRGFQPIKLKEGAPLVSDAVIEDRR